MKELFNVFCLTIWSCLLYSCAKISPVFDAKSSLNDLNAVYVTFANGTGGFSPDPVLSSDSVLVINVPWFFPDGTTQESHLDSLIITGSLPNSSYLEPSFGLVDLTTPKLFKVIAEDGSSRSVRIIVNRKKSDRADITAFKLKESGISATIINNSVIIPYTEEDLSKQTVEFELSNYATIDPDPVIPRNYNDSVQFTVTAQDGTKKLYTVKQGQPTKLAKGFGSIKKLWYKSAGDLSFDEYRQISIAVSGDYFALPASNEWVGGSSIKYYNKKTGSYVGNMNVTGANGIYSIANDDYGHIVGINNLYAGSDVCLYLWDNVKSAPKLLAKSDNYTSVASGFYGRKLSVKGDLKGDAIIMATSDGSGANGANNILKWVVKDGQIVSQNPSVVHFDQAFGYVAKAIPVTARENTDYYLCSASPSYMEYIQGSSNSMLYAFAADYIKNSRGFTPALSFFSFNNANYAAVVDANEYSGALHIFDVTDPSLISTSASSPKYGQFQVFDGASEYISSPSPNYNITAEVAVGPVSDDGFKMTLYFLLTNGGVAAYELNCIDLNAY